MSNTDYTEAMYLPTPEELEILDYVLTMNHGHVPADNRGNGLFITQFIDLRENHLSAWRRGEATSLTHRHVQSLIALVTSYEQACMSLFPGEAKAQRVAWNKAKPGMPHRITKLRQRIKKLSIVGPNGPMTF